MSAGLGQLTAQERYSTGKESWSVSATGALESADWPILEALSLEIIHPKQSPGDPGQGPAQDPATDLPELTFGGDRSVTVLSMNRNEKNSSVSIKLQRSLHFDATRRAIRMLDVFTNVRATPCPVILGYRTVWQPQVASNLSKVRVFDPTGKFAGTETPADVLPAGLFITSRDPAQLPVVMFVLGQQPKAWKGSLQASQEKLTWKYSGTLPGHQRLVLLHWLVLRDDIQSRTLDQTLGSLIQKSLPVDPSLGDQVIKELANYPFAVATSSDPAKADEAVSETQAELHFVNALAAKLKTERPQAKDMLRLADGVLVSGQWKMEGLRLKLGAQEKAFELSQVAALIGGAGQGRRCRVCLRDGSVLSGDLMWTSAEFVSDSLGTLKLTPESLDTALLHTQPSDGYFPGKPLGWLATESGDILPCMELTGPGLTLRWGAGLLTLPWASVVAIKPSGNGDTTHEVALADGSLLVGWCMPAELQALAHQAGAVNSMTTAWAADPATLAQLMQGAGVPAKSAPEGTSQARSTDGSLWIGEPGFSKLQVLTASGQMELAVERIRQITRVEDGGRGPLKFQFTLEDGALVQGSPQSPGLDWKRADSSLTLPWFGLESATLKQEAKAR